MSELRSRVARLAEEHPELREALTPLLKTGGDVLFNDTKKDDREARRAIASGDDMNALHHLGNILYVTAFAINDVGDPMGGKVLDVARKFTQMHR